jgi:predicted nuclease of predicted toxin-antitoxin system
LSYWERKVITPQEANDVRDLLNGFEIINFSDVIKDITITLKQKYSIKTPDTIIAATAKAFNLQLVTADLDFKKIKEVKYERYMCVMYTKLLLIISSERIYTVIAAQRYSMDKKILSREKCVKTMCRQINLLRQLINSEASKIYEILDKISEIFARGHILCQRKNRENFSNLVELFIYKSK